MFLQKLILRELSIEDNHIFVSKDCQSSSKTCGGEKPRRFRTYCFVNRYSKGNLIKVSKFILLVICKS